MCAQDLAMTVCTQSHTRLWPSTQHSALPAPCVVRLVAESLRKDPVATLVLECSMPKGRWSFADDLLFVVPLSLQCRLPYQPPATKGVGGDDGRRLLLLWGGERKGI